MWFKKYPPKQTPYDQAMERLKTENTQMRRELLRLRNQHEHVRLRISALEQMLNEFLAFTEKFPHNRTREQWRSTRQALVERYAALPEFPGETDSNAPQA
jgi:predicted  nucleic acid-binding Zn-ribbon protein